MKTALSPKVRELAEVLNHNGVAVVRTDTLYGLLARAEAPAAVERVYKIKHRQKTKSPIVLISSLEQMFDRLTAEQQAICQQYWPGKVSIILPSLKAPAWLERGNQSIAYRMPDDEFLRQLLQLTGPLIAPSANPEGWPPAKNITEAKKYFGDQVDVYCDGGEVADPAPSKLLRINQTGAVERLR